MYIAYLACKRKVYLFLSNSLIYRIRLILSYCKIARFLFFSSILTTKIINLLVYNFKEFTYCGLYIVLSYFLGWWNNLINNLLFYLYYCLFNLCVLWSYLPRLNCNKFIGEFNIKKHWFLVQYSRMCFNILWFKLK